MMIRFDDDVLPSLVEDPTPLPCPLHFCFQWNSVLEYTKHKEVCDWGDRVLYHSNQRQAPVI